MASPSGGGSWKPGGNRPKNPQSTTRRAWQRGDRPSAANAGQKRGRVGPFVLAGFATLALVGLIVAVIVLWRPPQFPELLVVGPRAYGTLAAHPTATQSNAATMLAEWANAGGDRPKLGADPSTLTDKDGWKTKLNPAAKSLVLAFAAHGDADPAGPYLWFPSAEAKAVDESQKLRVKEILDRLAGLPADQPKLLIFDATQVPAGWAFGSTHNDFARAVKELDAEIEKVPGLAVILSSDVDQTSAVAEEWRASAFAHFLGEGLNGAADRGAGRITAVDLFEYLKRELPKWSQANRDVEQLPVLLPAGSGADRAGKLDLAGGGGGTTAKPPAEPEALLAAWDDHWKTAEEIAGNAARPPEAFDPLAWREYLDTLLRYEHLLRLGEKPDALERRLGVLEGQLRAPAGPAPAFVGQAFPAGKAFGVSPPPAVDDLFRKLWQPPEGSTRADVWEEFARSNRGNEEAAKLAVAERAVTRITSESPPNAANLKTVEQVLSVVLGEGQSARPAETHFVRMLHRHLPEAGPRAPDPLVARAIRLRVIAEETAWLGGATDGSYPFAEDVARWIRPGVETADRARQLGEDLLFAADFDSWRKIDTDYFPKAETEYKKAAVDAKQIANAVRVRGTVMARLPYYARWAANYRGTLPAAEVEKLLAKIESAAAASHAIAKLLADEVPADPAARITEIAKLAAAAEQDFAEVVRIYESEVAGLRNVVHPSNRAAIDNALAVPFLPAKRRAELVRNVRYVSHQLLTKSEQPTGTPAPAVNAQEAATRQGRMALAILGDQFPANAKAAEVKQAVVQPKLGAWWESARLAGEQIGRGFQGLNAAAAEQVAKANAGPLANSRPHFATATHLARTADPAAPVANDPPAALLRISRHDLLLGQARRALADGYADFIHGPDDQWYCATAARRFADGAKSLVGGDEPNLDAKELDRRLASVRAVEALRPARLVVAAPKSLDLTDEPEWGFDYTVRPGEPANFPVGFPVAWMVPPGAPFDLRDGTATKRQVMPEFVEGIASAPRRFRFSTAKDAPATATAAIGTRVLHRGFLYDVKTALALAGKPSLEIVHNPPTGKAMFAVTADETTLEGTAAVTLLLDLSGSMADNLAGTNKKKIEETFDALETMLGKLPRGTNLTIATFWGDTTVHTEVVAKEDWRGNQVQLDALMKKVRKITPVEQANTPMAGSVRRLLAAGNPAGVWPADFTGNRTLVVLTDGEDNWENQYKEPAGKVVLDAMLDRANDDDPSLHVIFFGIEPAEEKRAVKQFEVLEDPEQFRAAGRSPAKLYPGVKSANDLADRLREAILPRVNYIREETVRGKTAAARLPVSLRKRDGIWRPSPPLEPGVYNLWGLRATQKLDLAPGDRVVLQARRLDGKLDLFTPPMAADLIEPVGWKRDGDDKPAVFLTVPQFGVKDRSQWCDLQFVTTLESGGNRVGEAYLRQPRPLFAWFDVTPVDGKPTGLNPSVRIENLPGLFAPAWKLDVARWDGVQAEPKPPAIRGFWVHQWPAQPGGIIPLNGLQNPDQAFAAAEKNLTVSGIPVSLAGLSVEELFTESGQSRGKYLTVRLGYGAPGKMVLVRPGNLKGTKQAQLLEERHLYFDAASKYTARFGPLTEEDLANRLELQVYSVDEVKKLVTTAGRAAGAKFDSGKLPRFDSLDQLRFGGR